MEIRIIEIPPGDSPEYVRRGWVGLVVPLAGETGPRQEKGGALHYVVAADAALARLERSAPEAAAWLRKNALQLSGPGQTLEFPAAVCEKLIHLHVDSREVVVGTAPVSKVKNKFPTKRLRLRGADRLVLWPTVYRRIALIPLIIGAATVTSHAEYWLRGLGPPLESAIYVCLGAVTLALGFLLWVLPRWFEQVCLSVLNRIVGGGLSKLLPRRFEFDRASGLVRVSWPDPWRERSLSDVLAIQLIETRQLLRLGRRHRILRAYELILVLDDADQPRVSLATYPEPISSRESARAAAAELANFLGVPLLLTAAQPMQQNLTSVKADLSSR